MDNLNEMYKFLETQNLSRLNHEETYNRPITSREMKAITKSLSTEENHNWFHR